MENTETSFSQASYKKNSAFLCIVFKARNAYNKTRPELECIFMNSVFQNEFLLDALALED